MDKVGVLQGLNERFWSKVDKSGECWIWTACKSYRGYGQFRLAGRIEPAHRVSYELLVGPIPERLQLDHLCRVRSCVNPAHLEAVTNRENTLRGLRGHLSGLLTHCIHGHEFTPENTRIDKDGHRNCRACNRDWVRVWKAKVRQRRREERLLRPD